MSDNHDHTPDLPLARERFKKLIRLTLAAVVASLAVGGIGGYLVYEANAGQRIPYALLLLPTIAACVVFMTPLYFVRKRWFPTKEALLEAAGVKQPDA